MQPIQTAQGNNKGEVMLLGWLGKQAVMGALLGQRAEVADAGVCSKHCQSKLLQ